jgi:hypothetical protein
MSTFSEPPSPGDKPHYPLVETAFDGPLGGPSYAYQSAVIDCMKGGHVCRLSMNEHPLSGMSFGVAGTITPLVDLWLEEGRLPDYMRTSPKAGR